jgi:hypothetical protein
MNNEIFQFIEPFLSPLTNKINYYLNNIIIELNKFELIQLKLEDNIISNNSLFLIIFIIIALIFLKRIKSNFYFIYFLTLPGTFFHELMHYLFSFLLNGKPISFSIIPKKENIYNDQGIKIGYSAILGTVASQNIKWYNAFFIGLAPLFLYIFAIILILFSETSYLKEILKNNLYYYIYIYLIVNLIYAGFPSFQDWKIVFKYSWFIFIAFFFYILYLLYSFYLN